jgi:ribosomal protein S18 acetylase RimI-like enzyme
MRRDSAPEGIDLRRLAPQDVGAVRALILDGLKDRWGTLDPTLNPDLQDFVATYGEGVTLTAWRGQRLVATGTLMPRGTDTAEVLRMSTASDSRRRGIASRLLQELIAEARQRGLRRLVLVTETVWVDARALYERHGFLLEREEDWELGRDAFYYLPLDS